MLAIQLVSCLVVCAPAIAFAQTPEPTSPQSSSEPTSVLGPPPPWSLPDLSGTPKISIDVELALSTVATFTGTDSRNARTAFLVSAVSAETRVSTGWMVGGEVPYVISSHPDTVSGIGNVSAWARWGRMNRTDARTRSFGLRLMVPTATESPVPGPSDPELASELWITDFGRFRPEATIVRAHFDWRAGTRTFVQTQLGLDGGLDDGDAFVLPRFSLGAGGYLAPRLAVVAEAVGTLIPGSGHDIGDGSAIRGGGEAGLRYIGQRFYTGVHIDVFAGTDGSYGNLYGFGVGSDVSFLF